MTSATSARRSARPVAGVMVCALALVALVVAPRGHPAKHGARHVAALTATVVDPSGSAPRLDAGHVAPVPHTAAVLVAWRVTADSSATVYSRTTSYQQERGPPALTAG